MNQPVKTLISIATYNEMENLPDLTTEIRRHVPDVDILIIDDNSPDGTGDWCDEQASNDERFHVIHRSGKLGLGTATVAGLQYAIDNNYEQVVCMDADFSHHPSYLPEILKRLEAEEEPVDVVIGSRYVPGGGVEGWPLKRRVMSRMVNLYARCLLGLRTKDCSGAYRGFRVDLLRQLDFSVIRSRGYSFFEEFLWRLKKTKARFAETPIVFVDRVKGLSKINSREAITALWIIFRLGMKNWLGI